jgi:hypothetical protein
MFIHKMEGYLYESNVGYYLINSSATYNVVGIEFGTFENKFITKDDIHTNYSLVQFNGENVKNILDMYDIYLNNIDYSRFDSYNELSYNGKVYIIKGWYDFYKFVSG